MFKYLNTLFYFIFRYSTILVFIMPEEKIKIWSKLESFLKKWGLLVGLLTAIGGGYGYFISVKAKVDVYINQRASEKISEYRKQDKKDRDSLVNAFSKEIEFLNSYIYIIEYKIDQNIEAIKSELDKSVYKGVVLYKSNPNSLGYSELWCIVKEENRKMLYKAHYNATEDAYTYYDRKHRYHILKSKDIYVEHNTN